MSYETTQAFCMASDRRNAATFAQTDLYHTRQLLCNLSHRLTMTGLDSSAVDAAIPQLDRCIEQLQVEVSKDLSPLLQPVMEALQ